ncbi:MAG: branched-chain amino acid ABC transporter permease [Candidatus Rokubacteria bacterium]|nr:branched-chain amino acid ABC transporter permease [Candidatus Rokubacteria bacterium]
MQQSVNILLGGVFHAATLFLVAAGLQLVFGVQRIVNLACGSFYALGAFFGITLVQKALAAGVPRPLFVLVLLLAGLLLAALGPVIERLLRFIYDRDESFQLLLTFALVLMFEDVLRFFWGTAPYQLGGGLYLLYGQVKAGDLTIPVYNLFVIAAGLAIAALMGWLLTRTRFGRIVRATAENREMSEALGVNMSSVYARVFTLGTALGTVGGALVVPATAAVLEMGIELIVEAFAVVVIGGLGSMRGAFVGALTVGVQKAVAIATYPELELLAIYLIVIAVLVLRPAGLFARATA